MGGVGPGWNLAQSAIVSGLSVLSGIVCGPMGSVIPHLEIKGDIEDNSHGRLFYFCSVPRTDLDHAVVTRGLVDMRSSSHMPSPIFCRTVAD